MMRRIDRGLERMRTAIDVSTGLARDGFALVPRLIDAPATAALIHALPDRAAGESTRSRGERVYAMRNLLGLVPAVGELAASPAVQAVVEPVLSRQARLVRGLLFDKTPDANWKVAWHQDLSIAVKRRIDLPGFGPWSVKAGVQHVQPPVDVLRSMLTVRLHLDDCGPDNGPLNVLPGSHAAGVLTPAEVEAWRSRGRPATCCVDAGGALLMQPLLLHASSSAANPGHRRVIHLEFAACELPGGLEWHER